MDIKLLYTVGCSFTRMISHNKLHKTDNNGFVDLVPISKQWPHLLGDKFGIPTINDGFWGSSNQRSFRRLNHFLKTKHIPSSNVMVIVQITFPARFEMENSGIDVEDYTWSGCDYMEDHIRLNPGWMDTNAESFEFQDVVENNPQMLSAVCLPRDKKYSEHYKDGFRKVLGKSIRYSKNQEDLDEWTYIHAIKGLLNTYGVQGHIVFGDKDYKTIHSYSKMIPEVMDSLSIRAIADKNNTLDGYHPDIVGSQNVADRFYNIITRPLVPVSHVDSNPGEDGD
jgi:hypothetical protein